MIGIRGKSYFGDIAIDDISFVDSFCGVQPNQVINELSNLTTPMPVSTRPPSSQQISCNFDNNNKCGWIDDLSAKLKWTLNKGSTTSSETGPSTDVSGSGYYIYLETSNVNKGDKARVISQIINSTFSSSISNLFLKIFSKFKIKYDKYFRLFNFLLSSLWRNSNLILKPKII